MDLLTINVPGMPGYQLHHLGRSFTTKEALAALHGLGRKSPGMDALVELRKKYPLYELPEVAAHLKEVGHSGLSVLSALEADYEWCGPDGGRMVGCFSSYPGGCLLHLCYRGHEWDGYCWLLSVGNLQA